MIQLGRLAAKSKAKLRSVTSTNFWLRYGTLAAYRAVCAATSAVTGFTTSGAAHAEHSTEDAIGYIRSVFGNYKAAAAVPRFFGKAAEIGPGDSCGIGLLFLADGCEQVDLVDRFFSARDEETQRAINRALVLEFPQLSSQLLNGDFSERSFTHLTRYYGESAAAETFFEHHTGYDFIVSCAVLEHVYDPSRAIASAAAALKPNGMMLHQVDCRDHGQFSTNFHELKFLEVPSSMYSPLRWGGGPNRVRLSAYLTCLQECRMDHKILVTSLAGIPDPLNPKRPLREIPEQLIETSRRYVSEIRPQLAQPFREMSDEDLMVSSFMIVSRKRT